MSTAPTRRMMASRLGKMPTTSVRRRSSRFSRSWGLEDQTWRQVSRGTAVKASRSSRAAARWPAAAGSLASRALTTRSNCAQTSAASGLVEDGADERGDPGLAGLGDLRQKITKVVGPAPLPARAGQRGGDRGDQPGVGVGGDQDHAGQAAGDQAAEERQPPGAVLAAGDLQAEDLPVAAG